MRCTECNKLIPAERLAVLPDTENCVRCSRVTPLTENVLALDGADSTDLARAVSHSRE